MQPCWETLLQVFFLIKLNTYLSHDGVVSLLDIYPRKIEISILGPGPGALDGKFKEVLTSRVMQVQSWHLHVHKNEGLLKFCDLGFLACLTLVLAVIHTKNLYSRVHRNSLIKLN